MSSQPVNGTEQACEPGSHQRLNIRFKSVDSLKDCLAEGLQAGYLSVPNRKNSRPGQHVEIELTLPCCCRMLKSPAIVERVFVSADEPYPSMILRVEGIGRALPGLLERFVEQCRGQRCSELSDLGGGTPRCELLRGPMHRRARRPTPVGGSRRSAARQFPTPKSLSRAGEPRMLGTKADKAASLIAQAVRAYDEGRRNEAIELLRLARVYEPMNVKIGAILRFIKSPH